MDWDVESIVEALFGQGKVSMGSMVFLWDVLGHGIDIDIQGQHKDPKHCVCIKATWNKQIQDYDLFDR